MHFYRIKGSVNTRSVLCDAYSKLRFKPRLWQYYPMSRWRMLYRRARGGAKSLDFREQKHSQL